MGSISSAQKRTLWKRLAVQLTTPLIDIQQVSNCFLHFLKSARCQVDLDDQPEKCVLNQAVGAVVFGSTWRPPHLPQNDALMLLESLRGFVKDLAAQLNKAPVWTAHLTGKEVAGRNRADDADDAVADKKRMSLR